MRNQSYFSNCYNERATQDLRTYFSSVVKGYDKIIDTPFAKGESTSSLLGGWLRSMESLSGSWPSLLEYEKDQAAKVGPMSIRKPLKQRMEDIDSYYDGILLPSDELDDEAVNSVIQEFRRISGMRMRSLSATWDDMKKSTNSGFPYFTTRRIVKNETLRSNIRMGSDGVFTFSYGRNEDYSLAAILGWRGQEGGPKAEDVKQRVVWMFPAAVNLWELRAYQPLIIGCQRTGLVPSWVSMDAVDARITRLFDSKKPDDLVVCTDFSKFDQHFNARLQDAACTILRSVFSPDAAFENWLANVYPIKYMIPLAYNWDEVRFGKHGMGSGSGGTNADETLAHRALQYDAAIRSGAKLNPNSQCLGDDGVLTFPGITVEDVVEAYTSHGLDMNPDKQYVSTQDCIYLRRWHHKDYRVGGVCAGVYSTCRALGRLRYLERWQNPKYWDAKAVALRQLSILENCKYHPLKEEFVDYCMKRDKYRLGIDIPHFLDDIESIAQEKIDHMPDFLGYTRTLQAGGDPLGGIKSWWIVNYLKSK